MKLFLAAALGCLSLCAPGALQGARAQDAPAGPVTLSRAEDLAGWGQGATLTGERKEGARAVAWAPGPDETVAALSFALGARREAVARGKTLSFWYRIEGAKVASFMVKVVAYPLAGGWQAVYDLPVPPPGEWRRARIPLQAFEDQWGDAPEKEQGALQFRVAKDKGAAVRLLLDDVQVAPLPPGAAVNTAGRRITPPPKPLIVKDKPMNLPPHPRLLLTPSDIAVIKGRTAGTEWAKAFHDDLKKRGDEWLARAIQLPPRGGQWYHWYACPKHGTRLRTEGPTRHVCPTGGEAYTGYPYDDVVLSRDHDRLAGAVRDLGLLYQVSGDKRYAAKAREILLAYAGRYLSYPLHNINNEPKVGGGRVGPQTLDESTWLIPMAQGADAVWDTFTPAEIESLKTKLFYPAVEVIRQHRMSIHNIQCWKNSAVGLVGLLFGDPALAADAVDSEHGYQAQMAQGVNADGAWYEGAWGYHFYTMDAVRPLTEAAFRCGINLYGDAYKKMFLAPIELAMPDGRLPAFNDSNTASAMGNANYEIALARYKDPRFALPLAKSDRRTLQAFVNGVASLPPVPTAPEPGRNYPASGYAILRAGAGAGATWLCLKYGPHGGGHGHPDKNSFVLYGAPRAGAGGRVLAGDPGTANYGVPIQLGWYKTTLAHNTLVVDETNQRPATGSCLDFQIKDGWSAALTDAGTAIPDVSFRRAAFLVTDDLVVFLDLVNAEDGSARTLDLAYHPAGAWGALSHGEGIAPPDKPGYSYLRDVRQVTNTDGLTLAVTGPEAAGSAIAFAASPGMPTTFWTGTGVGANTEDRVPVVLARRKAASTAYVWAVAVGSGNGAPAVTAVAVTGADGKPLAAHEAAAARVTHGGKTYLVVANPGGRGVKSGAWSGSDKLAVIRQ